MVELGVYQHYKGGRYEVVANALDEATERPVVVYQALYDNPKSKFWVRAVDDFLATVETEDGRVVRFKKLTDSDAKEAV